MASIIPTDEGLETFLSYEQWGKYSHHDCFYLILG